VDCDGNLRSGLDLCDNAGSKGIFGVLANVNVSGQFGSATLIHDVGVDLGIANDGGVLLTWANTSTVACDIWINWFLSIYGKDEEIQRCLP
jgi:hypothetical protein